MIKVTVLSVIELSKPQKCCYDNYLLMEKGPEDRKGDVHLQHTEKKFDVVDFLLLKSIDSILINE